MRKRLVLSSLAITAAIVGVGVSIVQGARDKPTTVPKKHHPLRIVQNLPTDNDGRVVRDNLVVVDFDASFSTGIAGNYQFRVYVYDDDGQLVGGHEFPAFPLASYELKADRFIWGMPAVPGEYDVHIECHHLAKVVAPDGTVVRDSLRFFKQGHTVVVLGQ